MQIFVKFLSKSLDFTDFTSTLYLPIWVEMVELRGLYRWVKCLFCSNMKWGATLQKATMEPPHICLQHDSVIEIACGHFQASILHFRGVSVWWLLTQNRTLTSACFWEFEKIIAGPVFACAAIFHRGVLFNDSQSFLNIFLRGL